MDLVLARSRSGAIRKPETASCGLSPRCIYGSIIYDRVVGVCARARVHDRSRDPVMNIALVYLMGNSVAP